MKYVFSNSICECSMGTSVGILKTSGKVINNEKCIITCNIKPNMSSVMCNSSGNPAVVAANGVPQLCTAQFLGDWSSSAKVECCGQKAVLSNSTLNCIFGGTIKIKNSSEKVYE